MKPLIQLQRLTRDEDEAPAPWMPWSSKYVAPSQRTPEFIGVLLGMALVLIACVAMMIALYHREPRHSLPSPSSDRRI